MTRTMIIENDSYLSVSRLERTIKIFLLTIFLNDNADNDNEMLSDQVSSLDVDNYIKSDAFASIDTEECEETLEKTISNLDSSIQTLYFIKMLHFIKFIIRK